MWPFARAIEARVELSSGRPTEALAAARAAHAFLSGPGLVEEGETEIRLVYAEALAATGDRTGAKTAIGEARRRLLERAAGIGSAELRERFLARVPDHRRTLELANLWASG